MAMAMEVCQGEGDGGGADIISSLPEGILSHIISFLPLEEAIRTCLLSRKWRYIFTLISNIDTDIDNRFLFSRRRGEKKRFMKLVDGFLECRTGFVDKLRIRCLWGVHRDRVEAWIRYALRNKVRELDLSLQYHYRTPSQLPIETFTCDTLEVLRLSSSTNFVLDLTAAKKICLPNLKCLHLQTTTLDSCDSRFDSDSIQRLIRSCSLLEELVLVLHASSLTQGCISNVLIKPRLKRLEMSSNKALWNKDNLVSFHSTSTTICCLPSLKHLHLCYIRIFDAHSFQTLISSCLALEELVLTNCHLDNNSPELNVFNPTLKSLTISCIHHACRRGFGQDDYEISIDAPRLVYFNYGCCRPFLLKYLNSLIHVRLEFFSCFHSVEYHCTPAPPICLFKAIGNTQSLHLSLIGYAQVLLLEGSNHVIPEFPKLTYLKLNYYSEWLTALPELLSKFPLLEALDLKINLDCFPEINIYRLRCQHFSLWSPLKKLELLSFRVEDREMQFIDYFLKNAQALENLTIKIERRSRELNGEEWMSNIVQRVSNLPKISTKCKISVV